MNYLTKEEARKLALENQSIMDFFRNGYSQTLHLTNDKVMNDTLVKPNDYFVNSDFANNPIAFAAHYADRKCRVLRVIYVDPSHRSNGIGKDLVRFIQAHSFDQHFLQLAVKVTNDDRYTQLNNFYRNLGFKAALHAVDHGNGNIYQDYFWAKRDFAILQNGDSIDLRFQ